MKKAAKRIQMSIIPAIKMVVTPNILLYVIIGIEYKVGLIHFYSYILEGIVHLLLAGIQFLYCLELRLYH